MSTPNSEPSPTRIDTPWPFPTRKSIRDPEAEDLENDPSDDDDSNDDDPVNPEPSLN